MNFTNLNETPTAMSTCIHPLISRTSRPASNLLGAGLCALFTACHPGSGPETVAPPPFEPVQYPLGEVRVSGDAELGEVNPDDVVIHLKTSSGRGSVIFEFPEEGLDISEFQNLALQLQHETDARLDILLTGLSSLENQWANRAQGRIIVRPGQKTADLLAFMNRSPLPEDHPLIQTFGHADGLPGGHHRHWEIVDPASILRVSVRIDWTGAEPGQTLWLSLPQGAVPYSSDPALMAELDFPVVDQFGQMRSKEWDGKLSSADELTADAEADLAWAASVTDFGPERGRFGGFSEGPRLEATGFFRVEKVDGHWWFVDSDGHLFWSVGANSVASGSRTQVTGREKIFPEGLSGTVDFHEMNLALKYGEENWEANHVEVTLARMRDWGMNTVGAWSRRDLFEQQKVPFTIQIHTDKEGVGSIGKMPDPFDTRFRNSLENNLSRLAEAHADNPWLMGIFIHNELNWGGGIRLGEEILGSGRNRPARRAAVEQLEEIHGEIAALNAAWGSQFPDFDSVRPLENGNAAYTEDVKVVMDRFATRYFEICRDMMRQYFPNHLYLGGRFHNFNPVITRAASRYQDVVSLNIYRFGVTDFSVQMDTDRPMLIGEFHFGIGDHGHWGRGLRAAADAQNQADLLQVYLEEALRHPAMIGAHWFAWPDQPVTGRGSDGENYGIGLVSVVDRPHRLLVDTLRETARNMYNLRLDSSSTP